jgi:quercetin dioxygenase-like cupin family protein
MSGNSGRVLTEAVLIPDIEHVRRVVTGHDDEGRSRVLMDGSCPHLKSIPEFPSFRWTDLWITQGSPADNAGRRDDADGPVLPVPPPGGTIVRVIEVAPDPPGLVAGLWPGDPFPGMHETPTVDFVFVLSGEITCVLEEGEVTLHPGESLIQRGANHAWINRGKQACVFIAALIDAHPRR